MLVARELFEAAGYPRVTMEQIASRASVSKRTLYKCFPVKQALLERLLEAELAELRLQRDAGGGAGFRRRTTALLQQSARWCEQHRDHLLPYIRYKFASFDAAAAAAASAEDRGLLPVWTALIAAAQARKELAAAPAPEQLGLYFHYLYHGALMRWLTDPRLELRKEFDAVIALFVEGAARRAGSRAPAARPARG